MSANQESTTTLDISTLENPNLQMELLRIDHPKSHRQFDKEQIGEQIDQDPYFCRSVLSETSRAPLAFGTSQVNAMNSGWK